MQNCPCGSNQPYPQCCGPLIQGKRKAETAVELMKSRYSAFVKGEVDYILSTHHSRTREGLKREEIEEWSKQSEWQGLEISATEAGGPSDQTGTVTFTARYVFKGKPEEHVEKSLFERENGEWRFVDVLPIKGAPLVRSEPKIGRNDPCTCGSGQKFKKCCGV